MVATSLPFWMQHPSRTIMPFLADDPVRGNESRRVPRRSPPPRAGAIIVEVCPALAADQHVEAWADLAGRAIEPNVFMEPGFALPAVLHFAASQRPVFLLCWEQAGEGEPTLIGVLGVQEGRSPFAPVGAAWHHPLWVTSAPLLDRAKGAAALDAMLGWLAMSRRCRGGLLVRGVSVDGPLMRLLQDQGRRDVAVLATRSRATTGASDVAGLSSKHRKELRRQGRRLGVTEIRSARSVDEIRAATERFLELEARGWKGANGTALLCDAHLTTFTRTMTRLMAVQGLCRIDTLAVDGEPAAMGIVLRSGDRAFFWKTAYDERRRRLSPGKQLAQAIGMLQRDDATLTLTDSCAAPDHPMIDAVWSGRMTVADCLVACPGHGGGRFARAAFALRLAGTAREGAKRLRNALRKRFSRR